MTVELKDIVPYPWISATAARMCNYFLLWFTDYIYVHRRFEEIQRGCTYWAESISAVALWGRGIQNGVLTQGWRQIWLNTNALSSTRGNCVRCWPLVCMITEPTNYDRTQRKVFLCLKVHDLLFFDNQTCPDLSRPVQLNVSISFALNASFFLTRWFALIKCESVLSWPTLCRQSSAETWISE